MNATEPRADWLTRALPTVALVAFLFVAAPTEWSLATDVMKLNEIIAVGVPVTIDAYVLAAFRSGRDVAAAMAVMALSLAAATGAHIAAAQAEEAARTAKVAGHTVPAADLPLWATVTVTGVMLLLLVVVLWRIHVISHPIEHRSEMSTDRVENLESGQAEGVVRIEQIRTPDPIDPIHAIESNRHTTGSVRTVAASIGSTRSVITEPVGSDPVGESESIGSDPATPPRSDPHPIPATRSPRPAEWAARSRIGSDRSDAAVLADLLAALGSDPVPSADSIRAHYRIAPKRARALRDALQTDRQQQAAGEGEIS